MRFPINNFLISFKRSVVFGLAAAGLFCGCISTSAQERAGGDRPTRSMERIDQEEGARRLAAFRQQRLDGDFCFEFELQYKPKKSSRTIRYQGMMWGSWNEQGPITRFRVFPNLKANEMVGTYSGAVELIIQNGARPQAWIRHSAEEAFVLLEGEALFEPILPGLLYSPFDLQMPFVYWTAFTYEGPTLIGASRIAQQFLMHPPLASPSAERGITGVRVGLDDTYNALWRIEVMGANDQVASRFAVNSFQKVQEQYIVKRITLTDYPSKDSTTFSVEAASIGMSLSRDLFAPDLVLSLDRFIPVEMNKL